MRPVLLCAVILRAVGGNGRADGDEGLLRDAVYFGGRGIGGDGVRTHGVEHRLHDHDPDGRNGELQRHRKPHFQMFPAKERVRPEMAAPRAQDLIFFQCVQKA